jgi:hypothetical protein
LGTCDANVRLAVAIMLATARIQAESAPGTQKISWGRAIRSRKWNVRWKPCIHPAAAHGCRERNLVRPRKERRVSPTSGRRRSRESDRFMDRKRDAQVEREEHNRPGDGVGRWRADAARFERCRIAGQMHNTQDEVDRKRGHTLRMGGRERTTKRNWPSRVEVTEAVLGVVRHPALGSRWLLNSQGPG